MPLGLTLQPSQISVAHVGTTSPERSKKLPGQHTPSKKMLMTSILKQVPEGGKYMHDI